MTKKPAQKPAGAPASSGGQFDTTPTRDQPSGGLPAEPTEKVMESGFYQGMYYTHDLTKINFVPEGADQESVIELAGDDIDDFITPKVGLREAGD